ncbi:MAG TPA: lysylphosphatidylglycerol synthase transmembrane domain-containing protein [Gemmatimonadaceae bacterium]|nr:lysylphosphatidylglycerol synthase transmembrane domain-containing protein [Gemmatimonadaceae bacterium]
MRLRTWQAWLLRLVGTAGLLVGIFWFIPFAEVAGVLQQVKPGYVAAGFAVELTGIYVQAFQLWLLLRRQGLPVGPWQILEINMITRFYGQFLPSELLAGAVKLHRLAGPTKQWGEVVASLTLLRLVTMMVLVLLGLLLWAVEMPSGPGRWAGLVLAGVAAALALAHVVLVSSTASRMAQRLVPRRGLSWLEGSLVDRGRGLIRTTVASYRLSSGAVISLGALAVLRHGLGMLSYGLFALALGVHLSYVSIGWIRSVIQVLLMLPISVGGIGVREGSLAVLLQEYGVPASKAVAIAFLLFAVGLVSNGLGGVLEIRNVLRPRRVGVATRGTE